MVDKLAVVKLCFERHPDDDAKAVSLVAGLLAVFEGKPPPSDDADDEDEEPAPETPGLFSAADRVWRHVAVHISDTGLSPSYADIAKPLRMNKVDVAALVRGLIADGYLRRTGKTRKSMLHVLKWPANVEPRETAGRVDGGGAPAVERPASKSKPAGGLRRFGHYDADPENVTGLPDSHRAVINARTLFPSTVVDPDESPRVLVSGVNQRKIGKMVTKGPWAGMPIYTLTLEERATCPSTCHHWQTCYGNGMQWARRHKAGANLVAALGSEIADKRDEHPHGFVVRLHILGDFYSEHYVEMWEHWLRTFPSLHVFGYTAHAKDTAIGMAIDSLNMTYPDRWVIRFSSREPGPGRAVTIWRREQGRIDEGVVCPAQTHADVCCGTCGLCWHPAMKKDTIAFMAHGPKFKQKAELIDGDGYRDVTAQLMGDPAHARSSANPRGDTD